MFKQKIDKNKAFKKPL